MLRRLLCAWMLLIMPATVQAQAWQDEWKAVVGKAKGQTLVIMRQQNLSIDSLLVEFGKRFGVTIEATVSRPSSALARIQTEQRNGQFVWDTWLGGTSNMVNTAVPAGLLDAIDQYLILPEVKDPANWRHPDFIYGDSGRRVVTHLIESNHAILRNTSVLPELRIASADDFLNPKLKGKISMRDASVPNFGTFMLATFYKQKGPEFLTTLLKTQDVKVYENPQQLEIAIARGGQAVGIGLETSIYETCRQAGGCKDVEMMKEFSVASSWGVSVPNKPPHPELTKLWLNWFLSKEGQETAVREWAKHNPTGGVSMRRDVEPAPGHGEYLPDFNHPEKYVFVGHEKGSAEINATVKLFKDVTGR